MSSVGKALTLGVTAPLVGIGVAAIKAASDAQESAAKFDVVFGGAAAGAREELERLHETIPLTRAEMEGLAAGIQDFLVPAGIARDEAAGMSVDFLELAGDLGSFNNVPTAQVLNDIKSALAGSSEPMMKYAVDTRVAALEAVALEAGLIQQGEALDGAARAQAVFLAIQRDSTDAIGDAARTVDSTANSMKLLWRDTKELRDEIGAQLIPIITPLLAHLRDLLTWLNDLSPATKAWITYVGLAAAALGPLLSVGSKVVGVFQLLSGAAGTLAGALGGGGALATGIAGLVALLTGPVGIAVAIGAVALAISTFLTREGGAIEQWFAGGAASVSDLVRGVKDLKGAFEEIKPSISAVNALADEFRDSNSEIFRAISNNIAQGKNYDEVLEILKARFAEGTEQGDLLRAKLGEMETASRTAAPAVQNVADTVSGRNTSLAESADEAAGALARLDAASDAAFQEWRDNVTPAIDEATLAFEDLSEVETEFATSLPEHVPSLGVFREAIDGLTGSFTDLWEGISGGEGIGGMLKNIGAGIADGFGQLISGGISSLINMGLDLAMKGLKKLGGWVWGKLKGLFGGPSEEELAGRDATAAFTGQLAAMLDAAQQAEVAAAVAGGANQQWAEKTIAIRDAYLALGMTEAEALAASDALWRAEKEGPEAVQAVIDGIQPSLDAVQAAMEATGLTMQELRDRAIAESVRLGISVKEAFDAIADGTIDTMQAAEAAVTESATRTAEEVSKMATDAVDSINTSLGSIEPIELEVGFSGGKGLDLGKIAGAARAGGLPSFATGGTVPGAIGSPQLVVAHGGETITPRGGKGGSIVVNVYVDDSGHELLTKKVIKATPRVLSQLGIG